MKPAEMSALFTHLAFCSGWANALAALPVARQVFAAHGFRGETVLRHGSRTQRAPTAQ